MSKLFKYSSAAILVLLAVTGCQKDFLHRKPEGRLTFEEFFQTEAHALEATNAVYAQYREFDMCALPYLSCTDILSDDADKGSTFNDAPLIRDLDDFTMDATNPSNSFVLTGRAPS